MDRYCYPYHDYTINFFNPWWLKQDKLLQQNMATNISAFKQIHQNRNISKSNSQNKNFPIFFLVSFGTNQNNFSEELFITETIESNKTTVISYQINPITSWRLPTSEVISSYFYYDTKVKPWNEKSTEELDHESGVKSGIVETYPPIYPFWCLSYQIGTFGHYSKKNVLQKIQSI